MIILTAFTYQKLSIERDQENSINPVLIFGIEELKSKTISIGFERYCEKTLPIIRACCERMAKTVNESLNASIGFFSPKKVNLKSSYQ